MGCLENEELPKDEGEEREEDNEEGKAKKRKFNNCGPRPPPLARRPDNSLAFFEVRVKQCGARLVRS